jgi:hypothetical protein
MIKELIYKYYTQTSKDVQKKTCVTKVFFNPSSFSACKRAVFYKKTRTPQSNLRTPESCLVMDFGSALHARIQGIINKLGILVESERLKTAKLRGLNFRYKTDGIVVNNGKHRIIEIKTVSTGGLYQMKKAARSEHVMQLVLYMLFENVSQGVLLYIARDSAEMTEYTITADSTCYRDTVTQIYLQCSALKILEKQILNGVLPDRDGSFSLKNRDGEISESFRKDGIPYKTDFRCSYCEWKNRCWVKELEEIKHHLFYIDGAFVYDK